MALVSPNRDTEDLRAQGASNPLKFNDPVSYFNEEIARGAEAVGGGWGWFWNGVGSVARGVVGGTPSGQRFLNVFDEAWESPADYFYDPATGYLVEQENPRIISPYGEILLAGVQYLSDTALTEPIGRGSLVQAIAPGYGGPTGMELIAAGMIDAPGQVYVDYLRGIDDGPGYWEYAGQYLREYEAARDPATYGFTGEQAQAFEAASLAGYGLSDAPVWKTYGRLYPDVGYSQFASHIQGQANWVQIYGEAAAMLYEAADLDNPAARAYAENDRPWVPPRITSNVPAYLALEAEGLNSVQLYQRAAQFELMSRHAAEKSPAQWLEENLSVGNQAIFGTLLDPLFVPEIVGSAMGGMSTSARILQDAAQVVDPASASGVDIATSMIGSSLPASAAAAVGKEARPLPGNPYGLFNSAGELDLRALNPFQATPSAQATRSVDPFVTVGNQLVGMVQDKEVMRYVMDQILNNPTEAFTQGIDFSSATLAQIPGGLAMLGRMADQVDPITGRLILDLGVWGSPNMNWDVMALAFDPLQNMHATYGVGPVDAEAFRKEWSAIFGTAAGEVYGTEQVGNVTVSQLFQMPMGDNTLATTLESVFGPWGRTAGEWITGLNTSQKQIAAETQISLSFGTQIANSFNANVTAMFEGVENFMQIDEIEGALAVRGYDPRVGETLDMDPITWQGLLTKDISGDDGFSLFDAANQIVDPGYAQGVAAGARKRNFLAAGSDYVGNWWTGNTSWFGLGHVGFGEAQNYMRVTEAGQRRFLSSEAPRVLWEQVDAYVRAGMSRADAVKLVERFEGILAGPNPVNRAMFASLGQSEVLGMVGGMGTGTVDDVLSVFTSKTLPSVDNVLAGAQTAGTKFGRFVMLDPGADRINFDDWIGQMSAFPYFATHTLWNWAKRLTQNPRQLGFAARYFGALGESNEREGVGFADQGTFGFHLPEFSTYTPSLNMSLPVLGDMSIPSFKVGLPEMDLRVREPFKRFVFPFAGQLFDTEGWGREWADAQTWGQRTGVVMNAVGWMPMWVQQMALGMEDDIRLDSISPMVTAGYYGGLALAGTEVPVPQVDWRVLSNSFQLGAGASGWMNMSVDVEQLGSAFNMGTETIGSMISGRFGSDYQLYSVAKYAQEMAYAGELTQEQLGWVLDLLLQRKGQGEDYQPLEGQPAEAEDWLNMVVSGYGREKFVSQSTSLLFGVRMRPVPEGEVGLREADQQRREFAALAGEAADGLPTIGTEDELWDVYNNYVDQFPAMSKPVRETIYALAPGGGIESDPEFERMAESLVKEEVPPYYERPLLPQMDLRTVANVNPDAIMTFGNPYYVFSTGPSVRPRPGFRPVVTPDVDEPAKYSGTDFGKRIAGVGAASNQKLWAAGFEEWTDLMGVSMDTLEAIEGLTDDQRRAIWNASRPLTNEDFWGDLYGLGIQRYDRYVGRREQYEQDLESAVTTEELYLRNLSSTSAVAPYLPYEGDTLGSMINQDIYFNPERSPTAGISGLGLLVQGGSMMGSSYVPFTSQPKTDPLAGVDLPDFSTTPFEQQLSDLIDGVGPVMAADLAARYGSWEALSRANIDSIDAIANFGPATAQDAIDKATQVIDSGGYEVLALQDFIANLPDPDGLSHIYTLIDPRTGQIRYVGKTVQEPQDRLRQHLREIQDPGMQRTKARWEINLAQTGQLPIMRVLDSVPTDKLSAYEEMWIGYMVYGVDGGADLTVNTDIPDYADYQARLNELGYTETDLAGAWRMQPTLGQLVTPTNLPTPVTAGDIMSGRPFFYGIEGMDGDVAEILNTQGFESYAEIVAGGREAAIKRLDKLPGVGKTTAELAYEFSLNQMNMQAENVWRLNESINPALWSDRARLRVGYSDRPEDVWDVIFGSEVYMGYGGSTMTPQSLGLVAPAFPPVSPALVEPYSGPVAVNLKQWKGDDVVFGATAAEPPQPESVGPPESDGTQVTSLSIPKIVQSGVMGPMSRPGASVTPSRDWTYRDPGVSPISGAIAVYEPAWRVRESGAMSIEGNMSRVWGWAATGPMSVEGDVSRTWRRPGVGAMSTGERDVSRVWGRAAGGPMSTAPAGDDLREWKILDGGSMSFEWGMSSVWRERASGPLSSDERNYMNWQILEGGPASHNVGWSYVWRTRPGGEMSREGSTGVPWGLLPGGPMSSGQTKNVSLALAEGGAPLKNVGGSGGSAGGGRRLDDGGAHFYYDVVTGPPRKAGADFQVLSMRRDDGVLIEYGEDGEIYYDGVSYGSDPHSAHSIAIASVVAQRSREQGAERYYNAGGLESDSWDDSQFQFAVQSVKDAAAGLSVDEGALEQMMYQAEEHVLEDILEILRVK